MLLALALGLGLLWWKVPGLLLVLKTCGLVGAIAKWLACGVAASAKCECGSAAKAIRLAFHIDEFEFSFDAQRTVIADSNFCGCHLCSLMPGPSPTARPWRPEKMWARIYLLVLRHPRIDFIRPGQHAALQVPQLLEAGRLQEMDGVSGALSAAAVHNHLDGTIEFVHPAREFPERN